MGIGTTVTLKLQFLKFKVKNKSWASACPRHFVAAAMANKYSGEAAAGHHIKAFQRHLASLQALLREPVTVISMPSINPFHKSAVENFREDLVRAALQQGIGVVSEAAVLKLREQAASELYLDVHTHFLQALDKFGELKKLGYDASDIFNMLDAPLSLLEQNYFNLIKLMPSEMEYDVYVHARCAGYPHHEAVAAFSRFRTDALDVHDPEGKVWPVVIPLQGPLTENVWTKMVCARLKVQHAWRFADKHCHIKFIDEKQTAMDVLISPAPAVAVEFAT
ncbi:MAG: hypothetical protein CL678_07555 [Bdellovibrionaceae bacterium]|nr:hypothetical protein [Pseudobdellovibrionaceae bacterium]